MAERGEGMSQFGDSFTVADEQAIWLNKLWIIININKISASCVV